MIRLIEIAKKFNVILDDDKISLYKTYYEMLIEKNKVMNLTTITDLEDVMIKHFLDSISIAKYIDLTNEKYRIIDIGTGAGFPGIPLKIAFPQLEITLVDSLNKRVKFLNEVIEKCDLKGIQAIHSRAENLARDDEYREKYDIAVSRAVANLATLSEYCIPFVCKDGRFISYKSGNIEDELEKSRNAIHLLGGSIEKIEKFSMRSKEDEIERSIVFISKKSNTSKKYPRKAGLPSKEPLYK